MSKLELCIPAVIKIATAKATQIRIQVTPINGRYGFISSKNPAIITKITPTIINATAEEILTAKPLLLCSL